MQLPAPNQQKLDLNAWLLIVVVALGYCVDAYDLLVFSAVRNSSLTAIGIGHEELGNVGLSLLNWQLTGLVIGGFLWGILADKFGRKSIFFFSIVLYSFSNIANIFVPNLNTYILLRFLAGIGLAGELGVGISLITENIPAFLRTYATTIVAVLGVIGAALGGVAALAFSWKACYLIGGCAGLVLLLLRLRVQESTLFIQLKAHHTTRGNPLDYVKQPKMLLALILCTVAGSATFVCVALFIQGAPDMGQYFGVKPTGANAVICFYAGAIPAIIVAGLMSKRMKSRKKPMLVSYLFLIAAIVFYIKAPTAGLSMFYLKCFLLGAGTGYWPLLVTVSAEHFKTTIRATSATSIPNIARAWSIPFTLFFKAYKTPENFVDTALYLGLMAVLLSLIASLFLKETFEIQADQ